MDESKPPSHHLIVEKCSWSEIIKARQDGVAWEQLTTRTGFPALGMAIFENSGIAVQMLLEMGAPPYPQKLADGSIWSPLWAAMLKKNYGAMDLLIRAGADPDEKHEASNMTPLEAAAKSKDSQATILLCRHGARPNNGTFPSLLWYWVNHTKPRLDVNTGKWTFPDPSPIMALLGAGARVNECEQKAAMGMGALELARRTWFQHPLSNSDTENAKLVFAAMERAALMEKASENEAMLKPGKEPNIKM